MICPLADPLVDEGVRRLFGLIGSMLEPGVTVTAAKVSLLVGTSLNLINQGSAVWHGAPIDWPRLGLNYLVPFLVANYSGGKARDAADR